MLSHWPWDQRKNVAKRSPEQGVEEDGDEEEEEEEEVVMWLSICAGHVQPRHSKIHDHKVQALE